MTINPHNREMSYNFAKLPALVPVKAELKKTKKVDNSKEK